MHWPARSPDLTPLDYFIWGRLKFDTYGEPINMPGQLRERILAAFTPLQNDRKVYKIRRNQYCDRLNLVPIIRTVILKINFLGIFCTKISNSQQNF